MKIKYYIDIVIFDTYKFSTIPLTRNYRFLFLLEYARYTDGPTD